MLIIAIGFFLIEYPQMRTAFPSKYPDLSSETTNQPAPPQPAPVYYSGKAVILNYHNISDIETEATVSPAHFRDQIEMLREKGYNIISLAQLSEFLAGKQDIPSNAVVITFDDGYQSVYQYAYPVLLADNLPASIFIIVKNIGACQNQIPKLTWDEMKEMQAHGISFYSHTYNSHTLIKGQNGTVGSELSLEKYLPGKKRYETMPEYRRRIQDDLLLAKTTLEKEMNTEVDFLALPGGYGNETVRQAAQAAGYLYILTVDPGFIDKNSDPTALKRINAGQAGIDGEQLNKLIISYAQ